jgi:hypothetical protein
MLHQQLNIASDAHIKFMFVCFCLRMEQLEKSTSDYLGICHWGGSVKFVHMLQFWLKWYKTTNT